MNEFQEKVQLIGDALQEIELNPDAALQKAMLEDGMWPTSDEYTVDDYQCQRAQNPYTMKVWYYYTKSPDWVVDRFERQEIVPPVPIVTFPIGRTGTEEFLPPVEYDDVRFVDCEIGDDRNDGKEKPWATIGKACNAGSELTVFIRSGVYYESPRPMHDNVHFRKNESYAGNVVIAGRDGVKPILDIERNNVVFYDIDVTWAHGWESSNWNWVVLKGTRSGLQKCTIYRRGDVEELWKESGGVKEFGISITGKDQFVVDCELYGLRTAIAVRRNARQTTIYNTRLGGCLGSVLNIEDSYGEDHGLLIAECDIGSSYSGDSIQFRGDAANKTTASDIVATVGVIIRNCDIHSAAENCIDFKAAGRVVVEKNMLFGNIGSNDGPCHGWNHGSHHMISCGKAWRVEHVIIRNNILMDGAGGIEISGDDYYMYHNTLINNNRDYNGPNQEDWGQDKPQLTATEQNSKRRGIHFKNNIAMSHHEAEVTFYLAGSDLDVDSNCYYHDRGAVFGEWVSSQDWKAYTFPEWRERLQELENIRGKEELSTNANPMFEDDGGGNPIGNPHLYKLWPLPQSPCVDAGGPLTRCVGGGHGSVVKVENAKYFSYGFGVDNHTEVVTINGIPAVVEDVNYATNELRLRSEIAFSDGDFVYSGVYFGGAPDVGAYQLFQEGK